MAARLKAMGSPRYQNDGDPRTSGPGFALTVHPDTLSLPLQWRKPRRVFVNSMSDLFHPAVLAEDGFVIDVLAVIALASQHVYQVLTKRPNLMKGVMRGAHGHVLARMWRLATDRERGLPVPAARRVEIEGRQAAGLPLVDWPFPHLWLGVSIESDRYTFRADHLRETPAALRFLSLEPLLGPLPSLNLDGVGWVIVGAESGRGARPMDDDWVRDIRDRCVAADIPFFFKQRAVGGRKVSLPVLDGRQWAELPAGKV